MSLSGNKTENVKGHNFSILLFTRFQDLMLKVVIFHKEYEQRHEISNNVVCATNKASDQPAHMRSLIRAIASRLNIL